MKSITGRIKQPSLPHPGQREISRTLVDGSAVTRRQASPWEGYLIFSLCAALYMLPFMRFMFFGNDEGSLLVGAARVAGGQVFTRDFFEVMGPGTFYWLAAFFKIFGTNIVARAACLSVSSFGTGICMYFLSRQVCVSYRSLPCIILAGCYFGPFWPGISHHVDSNFAGLASVVCMVLWHRLQKNFLLVLAGILAAITMCIMQPKGALLFLAFLLWLWLRSGSVKPPIAKMALVATGFAVVLSAVLAYFWSQGALANLVYANFTYISHHYTAVNRVAYAQRLNKDHWSYWVWMLGGAPWAYVLASVMVVPLILIASLPLVIPAMALRYKWKSATPEILLLSVAGVAMWVAELHRRDIYHLVFASPLLLIICVHVLSGYGKRVSNLALKLLAICSVSLLIFTWLTVAGLSHPTETKAGIINIFGQDPVLKFLGDHTRPGEEVFIYPYTPIYYFLTLTTNPTPYSFLMYSYNLPSHFREVVDDLDRKKVRIVVWNTGFNAAVAKDDFPGSLPSNPADLIVEPYLESHYRVIQKYGDIAIMERK